MIMVDHALHTAEGAAITELILTIFRANGRLLRAGDILSKDKGLTSARWQVLGSIVDTPKTVAQIAREFELSRQGVLWVVQSLDKDGIVELIDNPDHRRAKLVQLTRRGAKIIGEMQKRQAEWVNEMGAEFRAADLKKAVMIINRLSDATRHHRMTVDDF